MKHFTLEEFHQRELIHRTKLLHRTLEQNAYLRRAQQQLQRHLAERHGTRLSCVDNEPISGINLIIGASLEESQDDDEVFTDEVFSGSEEQKDIDDVPIYDYLGSRPNLSPIEEQHEGASVNDLPNEYLTLQLTLQEFLCSEVIDVTEKVQKQLRQQKILKDNTVQMMQLESNGEMTREINKDRFISIGGTPGRSSEA